MAEDRRATFEPADDAGRVWLLRCDQSLNWVMARFAAAKLDRGRHAYVVPVEHVEALRAFARLHSIALDTPPRLPPEQPTYQPPRFDRTPRDPRQDEWNRDGIRKVRKALTDHRAAVAAGDAVKSWEDW